MNYTINEIAHKTIESDSYLPFFYKFEIEPKQEFVSIEMHSLVDDERARLMAINMISEKISRSLKLHSSSKDFLRTTTLTFSAEYVTIDEREEFERDISALLKHTELQSKIIGSQSKLLKKQEEILMTHIRIFIPSFIVLVPVLAYFIFN